MGIDYGAVLFYGFPLEKDHTSETFDQDKAIYEYRDDLNRIDIGLEIGNADYMSGGMDYIFIRSTYFAADEGEFKEVVLPHTDEDILADWNDKLIDYCALNGFKIGDPKWYLAATIS